MTARDEERRFRRMVIGLCAGAGNGESLRAAAQLAAELGLDIEGLFIEDESLLGLAGLPFLREVRAGAGTLMPFDPARLEHEMRMAASALHKALAEAARAAQTRFRFASVRGEIGAVLAGAAATGDIVAVMEGGGAGARATLGTASLRRAALRSTASVLYIPAPLSRRPGAVVAVTDGADGDAPLAIAVRLAARSGNALVVLSPAPEAIDRDRLDALAGAAGLAAARITVARLAEASVAALGRALDAIEQRLIVMPRGALGLDDANALGVLAARHRVPVLVLEPGGKASAG